MSLCEKIQVTTVLRSALNGCKMKIYSAIIYNHVFIQQIQIKNNNATN